MYGHMHIKYDSKKPLDRFNPSIPSVRYSRKTWDDDAADAHTPSSAVESQRDAGVRN